jgi:hypothetical protein
MNINKAFILDVSNAGLAYQLRKVEHKKTPGCYLNSRRFFF